uniref:Uncharacterized protein n=1 Tax=Ananas comosus var. bracteatus TaxID=296719 RepID=A0A6V7PT30_ANACO|nr:unnamed protein product [Ananas comosus var. bracteatus]
MQQKGPASNPHLGYASTILLGRESTAHLVCLFHPHPIGLATEPTPKRQTCSTPPPPVSRCLRGPWPRLARPAASGHGRRRPTSSATPSISEQPPPPPPHVPRERRGRASSSCASSTPTPRPLGRNISRFRRF